MILSLHRLCEKDNATYGVLIVEGSPRFVTLEPPWANNQTAKSCIPSGEYHCVRYSSPRFGSTFLIPTEGRDGIVFHWGNTAKDTHGCVLIGSGFDPGGCGITSSRIAFQRFLALLDTVKTFDLIITSSCQDLPIGEEVN